MLAISVNGFKLINKLWRNITPIAITNELTPILNIEVKSLRLEGSYSCGFLMKFQKN